MDMEHIQPTTLSAFRAALYSPITFMSFIDRHILKLTTTATYNCDRLGAKGTDESYRNELQFQKLRNNKKA
jgi:hypothetical protein